MNAPLSLLQSRNDERVRLQNSIGQLAPIDPLLNKLATGKNEMAQFLMNRNDARAQIQKQYQRILVQAEENQVHGIPGIEVYDPNESYDEHIFEQAEVLLAPFFDRSTIGQILHYLTNVDPLLIQSLIDSFDTVVKPALNTLSGQRLPTPRIISFLENLLFQELNKTGLRRGFMPEPDNYNRTHGRGGGTSTSSDDDDSSSSSASPRRSSHRPVHLHRRGENDFTEHSVPNYNFGGKRWKPRRINPRKKQKTQGFHVFELSPAPQSTLEEGTPMEEEQAPAVIPPVEEEHSQHEKMDDKSMAECEKEASFFFKRILHNTIKMKKDEIEKEFKTFYDRVNGKDLPFVVVVTLILEDSRFSRRRLNGNLSIWKEVMEDYLNYVQVADSIMEEEQTQTQETKEGHGLGGGRHQVSEKLFIDLAKLKRDNIVELRYSANKHLASGIRPHFVNEQVKKIVLGMIARKRIDSDLTGVSDHDKQFLSNLARRLKIRSDHLQHDTGSYQQQFEVLMGEVRAGNSSKEIRHKLKEYLSSAYSTGRMSRAHYHQLLAELK